MSIELKVDGGEHIDNVFKEAVRLATLLNVCIEFNFNDVTCWGHPNGSVENGIREYELAVSGKHQYKFASAR